jgi:hypothetical protein
MFICSLAVNKPFGFQFIYSVLKKYMTEFYLPIHKFFLFIPSCCLFHCMLNYPFLYLEVVRISRVSFILSHAQKHFEAPKHKVK